MSTKWTYHKEPSFASNYFIIFLKILFQFKKLWSWFDVPTTQIPIFLFSVSSGVLFDGAFLPVSIFQADLYSVNFSRASELKACVLVCATTDTAHTQISYLTVARLTFAEWRSAFGSATLLKRDSNTSVFQWNLRNF